mmetsp:Transcript_11776/g.17478  ORF Transcript_11776/g.17478 Transcript_11776/m.17478 type:complete len:383 (+) Transcript_11776:10-1158(+)
MEEDDKFLGYASYCSGITAVVCGILILMGAMIGLFIFLYVFFAVGVTIDYKTYALFKNKYTNKVDTTYVYHRERYYNWIFTADFINYDALPQFKDFTTLSKAADGPDVSTTVSISYRLTSREDVLKLYNNYAQKNFDQLFETSVKATIRDVVSTFNQEEMVSSRSRFADALNKTLSDEIYKSFFYKVMSVSLQEIDLPDTYEKALVDRAVAGVKTSTASLRLQLDFIRTDTNVRVAQINQQARSIRIETQGQARSIALQAQTNATIALLEADTSIFSESKDILGLSNRELLTFIYYRTLAKKSSTPLYLNLKNPLLYSTKSLNTSLSSSSSSLLSPSSSIDEFQEAIENGHSVAFPSTEEISTFLKSDSKYLTSTKNLYKTN